MFTTTIARILPRRRSLGLIGKINLALSLRRERQRLALLDDRLLRDIGVSRREAEDEAARSVWEAPNRWRY